MKAYRRLIAVLGVVVFCWSANAFLHERDTNNTGRFLKLPLDLYENCESDVIVLGLLTICPLAALVNHIGWLIARRSRSVPRLQRIATLDEFKPNSHGPESLVYVAVFAFTYHIFPIFSASHLFARLFIEAPAATLWDFSAAGFFSGNAHRYEGMSYYSWMTILLIVFFGLAAFTFVRLAIAVIRNS